LTDPVALVVTVAVKSTLFWYTCAETGFAPRLVVLPREPVTEYVKGKLVSVT
jgi:hypothetical protein